MSTLPFARGNLVPKSSQAMKDQAREDLALLNQRFARHCSDDLSTDHLRISERRSSAKSLIGLEMRLRP